MFNSKSRLAGKYIFSEMVPGFAIGVFVFISILLLLQALRLAESILIHNVELKVIAEIMLYLSVSFLPAILPMSLLFAVLLTYSRMSNDSEIVAFKAAGISFKRILAPAAILGLIVGAFSLETTFNIGPWGNRQFEILISKIVDTKVVDSIKEGTFSEGFYDLVIYANKVDNKAGLLTDVFIYNAQNENVPITIIAKQGKVITKRSELGQSTLLRLEDGNIHRTIDSTYTKVYFKNYDINLSLPSQQGVREKSPPSLKMDELKKILADPKLTQEQKINLNVEFHKRLAIPAVCFIFSLIAVGLGTQTNKRSGRSGGMILCLGVIVAFWALYVAGEGLARTEKVPVAVALWAPNLFFLMLSFFYLRRAAK
jgi:lipopolysaccharide export system permease protein